MEIRANIIVRSRVQEEPTSGAESMRTGGLEAEKDIPELHRDDYTKLKAESPGLDYDVQNLEMVYCDDRNNK
jgi:hypothetical protein